MAAGRNAAGVSRRDFLGTAIAGGTTITIGGLLPSAAGAHPSGSGPRAKHVVLVDWDGFDPD